jgi:uncharacterized protein YbjQ (UPF0145 family)
MDEDLLELLIQGVMFLIFITVGFTAGTFTEKRHYASIKQREKDLIQMAAIPAGIEMLHPDEPDVAISQTQMVYGSVVLSEDYFKGFLAQVKSWVGGNLTSYESLMDRARREAVLRMKEKAPWADAIINVHFESTSIGKEGGADNKGVKSLEMMAYGTAIRYAR